MKDYSVTVLTCKRTGSAFVRMGQFKLMKNCPCCRYKLEGEHFKSYTVLVQASNFVSAQEWVVKQLAKTSRLKQGYSSKLE